ncbi:hypothetical protein AVEN_246401-1 [Araneus ventricosus]|uniref:Uncharacterized protein n=1 Tax=Araneus ventricosus TaxID=182803 RepID=A0A4Y2PRW8_ARAVE|nr:hypothetical protein AVEN_246401-1 [Araneus ventricosus]
MPTKSLPDCMRKLVKVYQVWRDLQKKCKEITRRIQAATIRIYNENIDSEDFPTLIESSEPGTSKSVGRKDFITDLVTLHWDGKLLPALSTLEERLPIVISYGLKKQLIAVPRLDNSTGKEQAQAVWKTILD